MCLRHSGLPMTRRALKFFFSGTISPGPRAPRREFLISLLSLLFLIKKCGFLRFFHFEPTFLYFNFHLRPRFSHSLLGGHLYIEWKEIENRCNTFFFQIFESCAVCTLQCDASRVPPLPYYWQNLLEKTLSVLWDPLARVILAGQSVSLFPSCSLKENICFGFIDCVKTEIS